MSWSKDCVISEISRTAAVVANPNANPTVQGSEATKTNNATFQINKAKLYVPLVTLSVLQYQIFRKHKKDLKKQFLGINIVRK